MTARTVRDVLTDHFDGVADLHGPDLDHAVSNVLRDLAAVLTSGHVYRLREVRADQLVVGDVIADKRGLLWSVTTIGTHEDRPGDLGLVIVRGDAVKPIAFAPGYGVQVLLAAADERALSLLERELGATVIERGAAA